MGRITDAMNSVYRYFQFRDPDQVSTTSNQSKDSSNLSQNSQKQSSRISQQSDSSSSNYFPRNVSSKELLDRAKTPSTVEDAQQQRLAAKRQLDLERARQVGERRFQEYNKFAYTDRRPVNSRRSSDSSIDTTPNFIQKTMQAPQQSSTPVSKKLFQQSTTTIGMKHDSSAITPVQMPNERIKYTTSESAPLSYAAHNKSTPIQINNVNQQVPTHNPMPGSRAPNFSTQGSMHGPRINTPPSYSAKNSLPETKVHLNSNAENTMRGPRISPPPALPNTGNNMREPSISSSPKFSIQSSLPKSNVSSALASNTRHSLFEPRAISVSAAVVKTNLPGPKVNPVLVNESRNKVGPELPPPPKPVDLTKQPSRSALAGSRGLWPAARVQFDIPESDKSSKHDVKPTLPGPSKR